MLLIRSFATIHRNSKRRMPRCRNARITRRTRIMRSLFSTFATSCTSCIRWILAGANYSRSHNSIDYMYQLKDVGGIQWKIKFLRWFLSAWLLIYRFTIVGYVSLTLADATESTSVIALLTIFEQTIGLPPTAFSLREKKTHYLRQ